MAWKKHERTEVEGYKENKEKNIKKVEGGGDKRPCTR